MLPGIFRIAVTTMTTALLTSGAGVTAQIALTPTPAPAVTAQDEPWFQAREPILFAGNIYYPAGAQVHFNRDEMVRTGFLGAVPLYSRTTVEPYSLIYVPLAGGLMQPYERRRSGELAGTVGSTAPSFPVESPAEAAMAGSLPRFPRAAGPPTGVASMSQGSIASTLGTADAAPPVATTGDSRGVNRFVTAEKPEGLNGIFVVFAGQRWFSSGPAVILDESRFSRVGELGESAVYRDRSGADTIYVVVTRSAGSLVAPYTRRQAKR